ncbi:MAG: caspase family protein, partial [Bacteroidota bacterium]
MPKGISLHIGVNHVSPHSTDYAKLDLHPLPMCENDANKMKEIAMLEGFESCHTLFTKDATYHNFEKLFIEIAGQLVPNDLFLLTFSGHGLSVPDKEGDGDVEDDGQDESWCLYDQIVLDDHLAKCLAQIRKGVRVVVISDSCNSGTMLKFHDGDTRWQKPTSKRPFPNERNIVASVVLLAACMDGYKATADTDGELSNFTKDLLAVW